MNMIDISSCTGKAEIVDKTEKSEHYCQKIATLVFDRNVGAIVHKRLGRHRYDVNENQMTQIRRERSIFDGNYIMTNIT